MENWGVFATVAGAAAASLTGLLFVAVSIRIEVIAKSQELRNRAAQTLALFFTVLLIAILLSIPDQSHRVLGVEFVVLPVVAGGVLLSLDRRARANRDISGAHAHDVAMLLDSSAPNRVTLTLLVVAGVLLLFGVRAGLDVLVSPVVVALAGGQISAWLVLTRIAQ